MNDHSGSGIAKHRSTKLNINSEVHAVLKSSLVGPDKNIGLDNIQGDHISVVWSKFLQAEFNFHGIYKPTKCEIYKPINVPLDYIT